MNLKEAFQVQNLIDKLFSHARNYINKTDNVITVKENHLRSKALEGQSDEKYDVSNLDSKKFPADKVIDFLQRLIDEREKLAHAINKTKANMDFDLDAAVYTNRSRHALAETLDSLTSIQSSNILQRNQGRDYVFTKDANGANVQTEYRYDIERIQTIDFDRNKVRRMAKGLYSKADEVSNSIDLALVNTQVEYEFPFNLHGDNDSIIEDYINSASN